MVDDKFYIQLMARPYGKALDQDEWKAMAGSPAWLRMRRNLVHVEADRNGPRWVCNSSIIGRHIQDSISAWLKETALDLYYVEHYDCSAYVYCLDRRDATHVRLKWHDVKLDGV